MIDNGWASNLYGILHINWSGGLNGFPRMVSGGEGEGGGGQFINNTLSSFSMCSTYLIPQS